MSMETIVVALGGNALWQRGDPLSFEHQLHQAEKVLPPLVEIIRNRDRLCITHGNGPQVGLEFLRHVLLEKQFPVYPLDALNASTQGWIGYMLATVIANHLWRQGIGRHTVALVTRVVVDPGDPAFRNPSKPIGPFYSREEAQALMARFGWTMREDAGRGWRVVVPSPMPRRVVEAKVIQSLVSRGVVVVAVGGGGIPVVVEDGRLRGVPAVIDKDLASAVLARDIRAHKLLILTGVDAVYLHFGTPRQRPLGRITAEEAARYLEEGHFPPGSMGPKIRAALWFLAQGGQEVIITSLERALDALIGEAGTHITRN